MPDTFTGDCIFEDSKRLRDELVRCLRFIRTIPDDRQQDDTNAWYRELRAIKREVKA